MYSATITVDDDILQAYSEAASQSPRLMQTAFNRNIGRLRARLKTALAEQPQKAKKPFIWKSERQRRAFFATNGFGGGIPYQRTNRLSSGWDVTLLTGDDEGLLQVTNEVPYARYVQGDDAQPGHLNTGWAQAGVIVAQYRAEAENVLIETWFTVTDAT